MTGHDSQTRIAELEARIHALEEEAAGLSPLADLGELAAPVAHHVNNFLNNILLDMAILENQPNGSHKESIEEIRRQGRSLALVVRRWQQHRRSVDEPAWQTDLGDAARRAVCVLAARPGRLGPIVPRFPGVEARKADNAVLVEVQEAARSAVALPPSEVERLVRFLTANAVVVSSPGSTVKVRLDADAEHALLSVEDSGPSVTSEALSELFDPEKMVREETNPLELAACHGLVRRRGGVLRAEACPNGGLILRAALPRSVTDKSL